VPAEGRLHDSLERNIWTSREPLLIKRGVDGAPELSTIAHGTQAQGQALIEPACEHGR
jgi:hypothetical protein